VVNKVGRSKMFLSAVYSLSPKNLLYAKISKISFTKPSFSRFCLTLFCRSNEGWSR